MKNENKYKFIIRETPEGQLLSLSSDEDVSAMNWVDGNKSWGTLIAPPGIKTSIVRRILPNGHLQERYSFTNATDFPIFIQKRDAGIYTTFNDNYENADICLEKRCHTHIFCGGASSYVMALRMGGRAPHLGLMLIDGELIDYSVERNPEKLSNDRGDFIVHPNLGEIKPGETKEIIWELFWFENREDFEKIVICESGNPFIKTNQCTIFEGEYFDFEVLSLDSSKVKNIEIYFNGQAVPYKLKKEQERIRICCKIYARHAGQYPINIRFADKETNAVFFASPKLEELMRNRCRFIANKQQYHDIQSPIDGAYLIYDNEEETIYYSHDSDHNGGRERVGMGVLLASYLQTVKDDYLLKSLESYEKYVYRELYDEDTGIVYNDILRNLDWHRKYNYPWMAVFQLELFKLKGERKYLQDAYHTMMRYYQEDGAYFYAIGIPAYELIQELNDTGMTVEAMKFQEKFLEHANFILQKGSHYPEHEVNYEQMIIAPGVSYLIQAYQLTKDHRFIIEAERQLTILYLFNGRQPNYHQFENAIRHWDGYWFGKKRMFGDTFPHYWSVMTGVDMVQFELATGENHYREIAKASLRGCLNLFTKDGRASCAMVFPASVNDSEAGFYDPWANDQDWALYYAFKYKTYIE
jgi:hypothetical protein